MKAHNYWFFFSYLGLWFVCSETQNSPSDEGDLEQICAMEGLFVYVEAIE